MKLTNEERTKLLNLLKGEKEVLDELVFLVLAGEKVKDEETLLEGALRIMDDLRTATKLGMEGIELLLEVGREPEKPSLLN
jgi:hypothetical protein